MKDIATDFRENARVDVNDVLDDIREDIEINANEIESLHKIAEIFNSELTAIFEKIKEMDEMLILLAQEFAKFMAQKQEI